LADDAERDDREEEEVHPDGDAAHGADGQGAGVEPGAAAALGGGGHGFCA
jgi:hypothetical protein